jgi:hypothetical protein
VSGFAAAHYGKPLAYRALQIDLRRHRCPRRSLERNKSNAAAKPQVEHNPVAIAPGTDLIATRSSCQLILFSHNPIRHRTLVLHDYGLEWLEPFAAESSCRSQQHLFINEKADAAVGKMIPTTL